MDHEEVKELLLKVYKADPTIRDYSGRQMKHYQLVAASKKSMHLVMPRKGTSPTFLVNSAKRTSTQVCFHCFKCIFKRGVLTLLTENTRFMVFISFIDFES